MKIGKQQILGAIALILMLISLTMFFFAARLDEYDPATIANCAMEIVISIVAFIYVLSGFSKKFSVNYKLYFSLCAATYIVAYVFLAFDTGAAENFFPVMIQIAVNYVSFGAYVLLAFAPDFGKKRSLITACVPMTMYILLTAYYVIAYLSGATSGESFRYLIFEDVSLISSCLLDVLIVCGKYTDKALRKGPDADK